jgi:DNA-binding transcriptional LysR family regulator
MSTPHQLELFYYVAKYQGISAAARHIPYGIGQPAISGQMSALESSLGVSLFQRKPFKLTEKGARLYAHIKPYYDGLPSMLQQLQEGPAEKLSLAIDHVIGPCFPSKVAAEIARRSPTTALELQAGSQARVENLLGRGEVDMIIAATERTMPGVRSAPLARMTPTLLVARETGIGSPGHFWQQNRIAERLIYPLEPGVLHHIFERGLKALGVNWRPQVRVESMAVIMEMVASGQGVSIGLSLPEAQLHRGIRAIPLKGFDWIPVTVCWKTRSQPVVAAAVAIICEAARQQWRVEPDKITER